jgi:hypothetical protein
MKLEEEKAKLYHERELLMKHAEQIMGRLSNKISRIRNA